MNAFVHPDVRDGGCPAVHPVSRRIRSVSGFTLVETMVASFILAFVLCAMASSFLLCKKSAVRTQKHLEAVHRGREQMETIMTCKYSDTALDVCAHSFPGGIYTVSGGPFPSTKDIRLTVFWTDFNTPTNVGITLCSTISSGLH